MTSRPSFGGLWIDSLVDTGAATSPINGAWRKGARSASIKDRFIIKLGAGFDLPPGSYGLNFINGVPVASAMGMLWNVLPKGTNNTAELLRRGVFFRSIASRGFELGVSDKGKIQTVILGAPKPPTEAPTTGSEVRPPPPGPAAPGYYWSYVRGKGWEQVKIAQ